MTKHDESMMKELEQNIDKLVDTDNTNAFLKFMKDENRLYEYEHIAVYMIYRYYEDFVRRSDRGKDFICSSINMPAISHGLA